MKEFLEKRWGITGWWQIGAIFIVFALTGSSSMFVGRNLMLLLGITDETSAWIRIPVKILLVFVVYQVLLLWIGFLFGQFKFFWNMEKKIFGRIISPFKARKTSNESSNI